MNGNSTWADRCVHQRLKPHLSTWRFCAPCFANVLKQPGRNLANIDGLNKDEEAAE